MEKKKDATKAKLSIVKNDEKTAEKPKALEPQTEIGKSMNDFCNQLQKQIDAIMRM